MVHKERNNWHTYDSDSSVLFRASFLYTPFLFTDIFTAFPFSWKKIVLHIKLSSLSSCASPSPARLCTNQTFYLWGEGMFYFSLSNNTFICSNHSFWPLVFVFLCFLFFLDPPLYRWTWFIHSRRAKQRCLGPCVASPPWPASRTTQKLFLALPM